MTTLLDRIPAAWERFFVTASSETPKLEEVTEKPYKPTKPDQ
jgi:hypothetical protein